MKKPPQELYGLNIKEIARICKVSLKTANRWKDGTTCPPQTALFVLSRDLGVFDPQWRGWTLRDGVLISPEGWEITASDVLATPLMRAQLATYQSELRAMQAERDAIDEQPMPDSWDVQITA